MLFSNGAFLSTFLKFAHLVSQRGSYLFQKGIYHQKKSNSWSVFSHVTIRKHALYEMYNYFVTDLHKHG